VVTRDPRGVFPNSGRVLLIEPSDGSVTSAGEIPKVQLRSHVARRGNLVYVNDNGPWITVVDLLNAHLSGTFRLPDDVTSVDAISTNWDGDLLAATPEGLVRVDAVTRQETGRGQIPVDAGPAWLALSYMGETYLAAEDGDVLRYGEQSLDLLARYGAPEGAGGYRSFVRDGKNLILGDLGGGYSTLDLHAGRFQQRVRLDRAPVAGLTLDGQGHLIALTAASPAHVWKLDTPGKAPGDPGVVGYRWTNATALAINVASHPGGLPFDSMRVNYGIDDTTLHHATFSGNQAALTNVNAQRAVTMEVTLANAYGTSRPSTLSLPSNSRTARLSMPEAASDIVLATDFRVAYVAGGAIQVLRTFDDTVVRTLAVSGNVLALGSDDTTLLVGDGASTKVVNTSTGATLRTVNIGGRLLAISPDNSRGYIATDDSVIVFDVLSGTILNQVAVNYQVQGLQVTPDGQSVIVVTARLNPFPSNNALYVFDRNLNLQRESPLPSFGLSPEVSPDSSTLYLAFPIQGVVRALDLATL